MKIQMLNTCYLINYGKEHTYYKGRKYNATKATNQQDYIKKGLVYVEKKTGEYILIGKEDYKIIS